MHDILAALADPTTRLWYLLFCFAVMLLPMIGLSYWYHANINISGGGRKLMRRQNRSVSQRRRDLGSVPGSLNEAGRMARDINAGNYGDRARQMQHKVYWVVAIWLLVNVIAFGILLWADEVNHATG